jgi:hypothetical protein
MLCAMRAVLLLSCCVILFGSLGACGGEEEVTQTSGPSLEEYVAEVEALRKESRRTVDELTTGVPSFDPEDENMHLVFYRRLMRAMHDGTTNFFDGMRGIIPPSEVAREHQLLVEASAGYQADLDGLVRQTEQLSSLVERDSFIPTTEGSEAFARACTELAHALGSRGFELDLNCEYGSFPGAVCFLAGSDVGYCDTAGTTSESGCETTAAGRVICCVGIPEIEPGDPPDFRTPLGCDEIPDASGTIDFGGIDANSDAPMPPLPRDLVAVSDYLEIEFGEQGAPNISGFSLTLTEEITDPSTIAFYTYEQGEWRRAADATVTADGRAEGEFTSVPANIAVLKRVP